ncbi:hypothetical protein Hanom_Chr10g00949271 [Helianthus anomalus]
MVVSNHDMYPHTFIYSLKKEFWSAIPSPSARFLEVKSKASLVNEILNWITDGYLTEGPCRFILTFDLSSHVFGHICCLTLGQPGS